MLLPPGLDKSLVLRSFASSFAPSSSNHHHHTIIISPRRQANRRASERGAPLLAIGAAKAAGPLPANHTNALTHPSFACSASQRATAHPPFPPRSKPFANSISGERRRRHRLWSHITTLSTCSRDPHDPTQRQATGGGHRQGEENEGGARPASLPQPPMSGAPAGGGGGGGGGGRRPGRNYANVSESLLLQTPSLPSC